MHGDMLLLLLLPLAFAAGLVSALSGGSGLVMLPTLLYFGVPPHVALGTNKLFTTCSTLSSSLVFIRNKVLLPREWIVTIVATFISAIVGVAVAYSISGASLQKIIPIFMIMATLFVAFSRPEKTTSSHESTSKKISSELITGSCIGLYSGFFGPGTAIFWVASGLKIFKLDIVTACALARVMCFVANITALSAFIILGMVNFKLGVCIGVAGIVGAYLGSKLALRMQARGVKPILIAVSLLMSVILLCK